MAKSKILYPVKRPVKATPALSVLLTASPVVEDYAAVLQLLYRYCHVIDRGTLDQIVALFHHDAVLLPRYESTERYEGREAVRGWYERWIAESRVAVRHLRHTITAPVIEVAGNEATAVCYVDVDSIPISTNKPWVAYGRYEDKLIKDGGRWWFRERTIIVYYTSSLTAYREGWQGKGPKSNLQRQKVGKANVRSPQSKGSSWRGGKTK